MSSVFYIGQEFSTFEELEAAAKDYQSQTFCILVINDCRRLDTIRKRTKCVNPALKYCYMKYSCHHFGVNKNRPSTGKRKCVSAKIGCPFIFRFGLSEDGQKLVLKSWVLEHNHEVTEEAYLQHHRVRRLNAEDLKEAQDMLRVNSDRKLMKKHFEEKTGKPISVKDINNIAFKMNIKRKRKTAKSAMVQSVKTELVDWLQDELDTSGPLELMQQPEAQINDLVSPGQPPSVKKRRFDECQNNNDMEEVSVVPAISAAPKMFLHLASSHCVFDATDHTTGTTLYHPITEDIMVNMRNIEQISFSFDSYFVANEKGEYTSTQQGYCIKLFRYSENAHSLYISRSFLVTDLQVYQELRRKLEAM